MAKKKYNVIREDMLQVASNVAQEKNIDQDSVFSAMEQALEKAARVKYGQEIDIRISIDRATGDIKLNSYLEVVESIDEEFQSRQILLEDAKKTNPDINLGEFVIKALPPIELGRVAAQNAKGVIIQKVREADKSNQYEEYKDKVGEIAVGIVKRTEFGNLIIDLGKSEAIIKREELIPRETFKNGDRVRAYIYEVKNDVKGYQVFLSRTHPQFLSKLFFQEVPEIYEGVITVKCVARDPGSSAKISVFTEDSTIDPVGACVGMRGSRVQAVVNELQGEKIDIVNWSEDPAILVSNALSPAEVQRVNVDIERKKLDVILTEENLSKAIGRRGQNVRLATKLLNYEINIMTDQEDSERRQQEFKEKTENFVKNLELDETLGQLLVAEGFSTIDDIKDSSLDNFKNIEGIEEDTAKALIERAKEFHKKDQEDISQRIKDLGISDDLINLKGLTPGMLLTLGEQKILKLEDFADLASDELTGGFDVVKGEKIKIQGYLEDFALSKSEADELIMSARNIVYKLSLIHI